MDIAALRPAHEDFLAVAGVARFPLPRHAGQLAGLRMMTVTARTGSNAGEQLARDCALPGGYLNGSFDQGWALILGRLAAAAGEPA